MLGVCIGFFYRAGFPLDHLIEFRDNQVMFSDLLEFGGGVNHHVLSSLCTFSSLSGGHCGTVSTALSMFLPVFRP